jgi:hypothetical protein
VREANLTILYAGDVHLATEVWAVGYALEPTNILLQNELRKYFSFFRVSVSMSTRDGVLHGSSAVSKEWVRDSLILAKDEQEFNGRLQAWKALKVTNFQCNIHNDYSSYGMVTIASNVHLFFSISL